MTDVEYWEMTARRLARSWLTSLDKGETNGRVFRISEVAQRSGYLAVFLAAITAEYQRIDATRRAESDLFRMGNKYEDDDDGAYTDDAAYSLV